jgi:hypothetical protein
METYAVKVMRRTPNPDPEFEDELKEILSVTGLPPVVAAALETMATEILARHETQRERGQLR